MKKLSYLVPALALALGACSSDEPLNEGEIYNGEVQTNFLTVNITSTGEMTRGSDGVEEGQYVGGINNENKVSKVQFYFFDAFGNSVKVVNTNGAMTNYLEWESPEKDAEFTPDPDNDYEDDSVDVRYKYNPTLIIQTPKGDRLPESVVAVINPTSSITPESITKISDLNDLAANFDVANSSGSFVMSNSVYVKDNAVMDAISVKPHLHETSGEAIGDPVIIPVERVNAKVRVSVESTLKAKTVTLAPAQEGGQSETFDIYDTKVENTGTPNTGTSSKIYVRLLGWNVTCTPNQSRVMKQINPAWTNVSLFGLDVWNWTSESLRRSFWATNPTLTYAENGNYKYGTFNDAQAIKGFVTDPTNVYEGMPINYTYVQENAGESLDNPTTLHPTQVIIAAQLVDENGNPLEIAEWGTIHYTVDDLKTNLANIANIYRITESSSSEEVDGGTQNTETKHWDKVDGSYFKFVRAEDVNKAGFSTEGRYKVYLQLDEDAIDEMAKAEGLTGKDDIKLTNSNGGEAMSIQDMNNILLNTIAEAKIWTEGKTYYYFDIQHLGATESNGSPATFPATYGIVRNHIYAANITELTGLGTPVFSGDSDDDTTVTIIPEKPDDDDYYIAAKIDVLNWRLVNSSVQLSW